MNIEEFRELCLSMPDVKENCPWSAPKYQNLITYTVSNKWFCLLDIENKFCDLKCSPDLIPALLEKYRGAQPAWHMNKKHWIKIGLSSDLSDAEIRSLVKNAYTLIVSSLPKSKRPLQDDVGRAEKS